MAEETTNNSKVEGQISSNNIWPTFGIPALKLDEVRIDCNDLGGLAGAVLEEYGLAWNDEAGVGEGGELTDLDIKRMDALTVINMSLIEAGALRNANFVEAIVNPEGEVEFRDIGGYNANIDDIYYEILTGSYVESPKAVMVTGGRPLPTMKELVWYPIWGENAATIYNAQNMLNNCRKADFSKHAVIAFNDPQLTTAYDDRIDNLYEINSDNPWDRVIGYAKYMYPGPLANKDTVISYTNAASIPLLVGTGDPGTNGPDMGKLIPKPNFNPDKYDPACWQGVGQSVDYKDGVRVDIPEDLRYTTVRDVFKDKFVKISAVYAVGNKIQTLSVAPKDQVASTEIPTKDNAKLYVSLDNADTTTVKLEPGKHYAVAYDDASSGETGKTPYIVFTKEVIPGDPFDYGKNQEYYLDPRCEYARQQPNAPEKDVGTIFPHTRQKGILVQELWVQVDLETPSITIYDPGQADGSNVQANAVKIAENLEYYVAPMVVVEPPAPIAYAGPSTGGRASLVDQVPNTDNDPTSAEDFTDREIERYMDEMQGGGMAITWSFLNEDNIEGMCDMLYGYFQDDVVETVYTCGPDCNPILGGYGERDGVVNAVRYNYTDSGSYTVSVTEGPKLIGNLTPVDGGPQQKMAENFSATGVIIDMVGDNIHFKVRLDGYGERWGVNMAHSIIRTGDVVQCTVHNNPVEA